MRKIEAKPNINGVQYVHCLNCTLFKGHTEENGLWCGRTRTDEGKKIKSFMTSTGLRGGEMTTEFIGCCEGILTEEAILKFIEKRKAIKKKFSIL